jgi:hypothetical protein
MFASALETLSAMPSQMESGWPRPFRSTISTAWSSTASPVADWTWMFRSVIVRSPWPAPPV